MKIVTTYAVLHNFIQKNAGDIHDDELFQASEESGEEHNVTTLPADDVNDNAQPHFWLKCMVTVCTLLFYDLRILWAILLFF